MSNLNVTSISGVCDPSLDSKLNLAIEETKRDLFIHHEDKSLVIGHSLPPKSTLKKWLSHIKVSQNTKILQVGCGSGYITAVLARVVDKLVAVDHQVMMVEIAQNNLKHLQIGNTRILRGEGSVGVPHFAPYDLIIVCTPKLPNKVHLMEQLSDGGQVLALEYADHSSIELVSYRKTKHDGYTRTALGLLDFYHHSDDVLIELGIIDLECLQEAKKLALKNQTRVIDEVRKLACLDDQALYQKLATECGLPLGLSLIHI